MKDETQSRKHGDELTNDASYIDQPVRPALTRPTAHSIASNDKQSKHSNPLQFSSQTTQHTLRSAISICGATRGVSTTSSTLRVILTSFYLLHRPSTSRLTLLVRSAHRSAQSASAVSGQASLSSDDPAPVGGWSWESIPDGAGERGANAGVNAGVNAGGL